MSLLHTRNSQIVGTIFFTLPPSLCISASASVVLPKPITCECYNATLPEQCSKDKRIQCESTDHDKPSHCFVLWSTNNQTGAVSVSMKGCFTYSSVCNQTECVDSANSLRQDYNFCCCKGDMCNQEHKWVPATTRATTEIERK